MSLGPSGDQVSVLPVETSPQATPPETHENHSYGQILTSSALVGGSSALNIVIGIVRTKAMAILLGPAGFGLFGLYGSIVNLTQSICGMGINSSGVRQIAEAVGTADSERIALTTTVLRRTSILLGTLGVLSLVAFSRQVSTLTFGNSQHAGAVSLLSLAVFFQLVSAGQGALIQGMRRIVDLAKMGVLGALFGTLISIPLVYFFREKGVVPSLVAVALMSLVFSWWYSRSVRLQIPSMTTSQVWEEAAALLKLGLAFMASGFMTMGIAYAVRIILLREVSSGAVGFYQSAWTLGGRYVGFILTAMGADFYPRLTAHAANDAVCNRLVNEQTRVGLLLACPGLIATLTFAPLVISLLYSAKFAMAVGVLRWICLGAILQVITWPMSFIIVAKGRQGIFFGTEFAWALVSLGLAWVCVKSLGLNGAGIAFFGSYAFYGFLLYPIVRQLSGFRWSTANKRTGLISLSLIMIVFLGFYALPPILARCLGVIAATLSGAYSIRVLSKFVPWDQIPRPVRRLLIRFSVIPKGSGVI